MTARDLAAMAQRVVDDGGVPIADRLVAVRVLHQVRHSLAVDPPDIWRLRGAHRARRYVIAGLAQHWCGATG